MNKKSTSIGIMAVGDLVRAATNQERERILKIVEGMDGELAAKNVIAKAMLFNLTKKIKG